MVLWSASTDRLDDGALLAAIAVGDAGAAAVLVRRHQQSVYGVAVTMCGDRRVAEDVAQLTFERVWRHAGSYDARLGTARTWILTITRRLCIDHLRARRPTVDDPERLLAAVTAGGQTVEDRAIDLADVSRLRATVDALPPAERRALLLATLGGHTAAEIAAIEQIPLGTAKTRIRRALQRVRDAASTAQEVDHG